MFARKRQFERLYIHVPFCVAKCDYCAFYSLPAPGRELISVYLKRLEAEMRGRAADAGKIKSVFLGGGTPTFLDCESLSSIFGMIRENFDVFPEAERSVECNPESLDEEKAGLLKEFCDRVSVGIQSFDLAMRKTLGRKGGPDRAADAVRVLRKAGFENIGADLIYGIPGQTLEGWIGELKAVVSLGVSHVSAYALTLEEGSALGRREKKPPVDEDLCADMWEAGGKFLEGKGIPRYEISNHAAPGHECAHNLDIWLGGSYLGCGPAAASFDGLTRASNPEDMGLWLKGEGVAFDKISPARRAREILVMGLRTSKGWDEDTFGVLSEEGGIADFEREFSYLFEEGLMWRKDGRLGLFDRGLLVWNSVAEAIMC